MQKARKLSRNQTNGFHVTYQTKRMSCNKIFISLPFFPKFQPHSLKQYEIRPFI